MGLRSSPPWNTVPSETAERKTQWLSLVLRKRKSMPSISPSMSMTSREMVRLTPSTPAIQVRLLPHVQGRQGVQGSGWIPRLCGDPQALRQKQRRHHAWTRTVPSADQPRREADQGGGQEPDEGALRA